MKAWVVRDKYCEYGSLAVFAETAGKAKSIALGYDVFEDLEYIELEARRDDRLDGAYRGKETMDWDNPEERILLVSTGWYCLESEYDECKTCPAKDECSEWERYQEEEEEE